MGGEVCCMTCCVEIKLKVEREMKGLRSKQHVSPVINHSSKSLEANHSSTVLPYPFPFSLVLM